MYKLLESKHVLFENLLSGLSGFFYRCNNDKDWSMLFISEGCLQLTGYSPNDFISQKISYSNLIHPDDQKWLTEKCLTNLKTKIPCNNEYRIVCKLGRTRWVREIANGIYNGEGEILYITGYIEEITSEKESRLLTSAFTSYQEAINSGSIVSITDKFGRIIYANELFCVHSQYKRHELIGQHHRIINSGYHSKVFFEEMWKTILEGKIWRGEIKNKAKDGSYYWVDTVITPVFTGQNEISQFLSIRNLISDKKNNEAALKNAYQSLISIEEEERLRFATQIHNETTQNLAAAKMLLSKEIKTGNAQIIEVYNLLDSVINDCYRLTSDTQEKILEHNGLKGAMEIFISRLHKMSGIQITLVLPQKLNEEVSKHTQFVFYRILQECLNNSINHSETENILITFSKWGKKLKLLFSDNGKGIDEKILNHPKTFEYIKMRVAALNGTLVIDTGIKKGTTLVISIPCC